MASMATTRAMSPCAFRSMIRVSHQNRTRRQWNRLRRCQAPRPRGSRPGRLPRSPAVKLAQIMHDFRRGDIMSSLTIRHVTTYRYRKPVAFGEHRMMLRPRRLPRSKSHRGEPRDQPGAQEPAVCSGRIRQSCGDRAVFRSFKRAALREYRAPRAFALEPGQPRSR